MAVAKPNRHLLTKAVESEEELRLANEIMAESHMNGFSSASHWLETSGAGYPGFRREHTRIAILKGEVAGALRVTTDSIRLGEARLKMGGFGLVTTAERHRHKGVCTSLMIDALRYMTQHGYHVSMLFGIPNFYDRFGFVSTLADYTITIDPEALPTITVPVLKARPLKPSDIPAMQRIHESNDADVPASLVRSAAHFTNKWDLFRDGEAFTTKQGKVVGYALATTQDQHYAVREVGLSKSIYSAEVLNHLVARSHEHHLRRLEFNIPPGHPFAHYLLQFASTHETRLQRSSGGMMAVLDIEETLENMTPEWESLLVHSALRDVRTELTLLVDQRPYRIRANRGSIDIAPTFGKNKFSLTTPEFVQLLLGYRYRDEVLDGRPRLITRDARELLDALFPKRNPYVWWFDRF